MVYRLQKLNTSDSLFLFGPRGTGKTTLLRERFAGSGRTLWIDLLSDDDDETFRRHPGRLEEILASERHDIVVIDEVQKNPKLLDIVHREIEKKRGTQFVLSGSSARKLKRGGANLLAGRAFTFQLFPLTHIELGTSFDLQRSLEFGSLPKLLEYDEPLDATRFLKAYVKTYLREEILVEQLVRNVQPFQDFLEISAQMNGKIINYSKIANDIGVDDKTVRSYYEILSDTMLGFPLPPFHRSIRKRQREAPKFFFFDRGICRALSNTLSLPLDPRTFEYGNAFEHFIILEILRLATYHESDFRFSYLRTKDDAEIDLIIERPGQPDLLVEIKSYTSVNDADARALKAFVDAWDRPAEALLLSRGKSEAMHHDVRCQPWEQGIQSILGTR
jgi:predicted AAA+ superfamily ATPase